MYDQDEKLYQSSGCPTPVIFIKNARAKPMGDGNLRLLLVDHPYHGASWDVMEEHGIGREVVLIIDKSEYVYRAEVGDDSSIYLVPVDECNDELPDNERFLEKAFNLRLRW